MKEEKLYMICTVKDLAEEITRKITVNGKTLLLPCNTVFPGYNFTVAEYADSNTAEDIYTNATVRYGIKKISTGFDSNDLVLAVDSYGGGNLKTTYLFGEMPEVIVNSIVLELLIAVLAYEKADEKTVLAVEFE